MKSQVQTLARRIGLASSFQLKAETKPKASGSIALAESLTGVVDSIRLNQDCGGAFPKVCLPQHMA